MAVRDQGKAGKMSNSIREVRLVRWVMAVREVSQGW